MEYKVSSGPIGELFFFLLRFILIKKKERHTQENDEATSSVRAEEFVDLP